VLANHEVEERAMHDAKEGGQDQPGRRENERGLQAVLSPSTWSRVWSPPDALGVKPCNLRRPGAAID
jgi:hypothetical protein